MAVAAAGALAVDGPVVFVFVGVGVGVDVGVAAGVVASILPTSSLFSIFVVFPLAGDSSERVPGVSGVMYRMAEEGECPQSWPAPWPRCLASPSC